MKSRRFIFTLFSFLCLLLCAQEQLPTDPELKLGTLPNGLTYYIRHNPEPTGRAECWMAHKVGSIVEEDDEQGLAHFLEHMAFNGTTNFPGQSMVHYLTASGMTYGGDINASTSFDETVYHISNVPTTRPQLLDSVLLIMRDLSGSLTLDSAAIEKEKGIIAEEWRSRNDYVLRIYERALPELLGESRYAQRIPIGKMDIVQAITRRQLLDFYAKWFRPHLQAIVLVGDFNADAMERRVKEIFSGIPVSHHTALPENHTDTDGIKIFVGHDEEAPQAMIQVFFPFDKMPLEQRNTMEFLRENLLQRLVASMIRLRLSAMTATSECPLQSADCASGNLLIDQTTGSFTLMGVPKTRLTDEALNSLLTEARRAQEHGFTASELERAITLERQVFNRLLNERDKHSSSDYVAEYIDHFINGGYIPGVEQECKLIDNELNNITLAEVNQVIKRLIQFNRMRVLVNGPQREPLTDKARIAAIIRQVATSSTTALADEPLTQEPLLDKLPKPGGITSERHDTTTGITMLTLSNGATVQLKRTTFQSDEILFNATSNGGCWAYGGKHDKELRLMNHVVENSALGSWTQAELQKRLSTTPLSLVYEISDGTDDINGNCLSTDLTTLLQLNYLYFTDIRPDETAYQLMTERLMTQVEQMGNTPDAIFSDSIACTLYAHHRLYRTITADDITATDFTQVLRLYRERVACMDDFTFSIVGNFDSIAIRPLIEQYIASIPSRAGKDSVATAATYPTGDIDNVFLTRMQSPKGSVYACLMGDMDYNVRNMMLMDITGQVMQVALTSYLREELHGTYGVDAAGALSRLSRKWMINAKFDTQPQRTQDMTQALAQAFDIIMSYGTTPQLLDVIKGQLIKQHDTEVSSNAYWLEVMRNKAQGLDTHTGYRDLLQSITIEELNGFITQLSPTTRLRVIMQGY